MSPKVRMFVAESVNTVARSFRFPASVIASAIDIDASPRASPTSLTPCLITGNPLSATSSMPCCSLGRNAPAAASLSSSTFGFRLAINFANVFCDSVRPSSGSSAPPSPPFFAFSRSSLALFRSKVASFSARKPSRTSFTLFASSSA